MNFLLRTALSALPLFLALSVRATEPTTISIDASKTLGRFDGMGCGAIFYEGHLTSLAERGKTDLQKNLYDDLFSKVRTNYLHLMIRHDHEPENDNADPWKPEFKDQWFDYCRHTLAICRAARERRPDMKLYATLYTPPAWMKTNGDPSAGGESRATLKDGMELEFAEFCWAFLDHMRRNGQPIEYLSIANEPDWPHTQPGCCFTPQQHADLFAIVAGYLRKMALTRPETPLVKLVAPNTLSAVGAARQYLPPLLKQSAADLAIVGSHDYDRRGQRWSDLVKVAKGRPVWCTEWCVNARDESPELIRSNTEFWLAMTEAFNQGINVWMAYDWVYPPRPGGEALTHVDWGNSYTHTKIYHGFRQWCDPLLPGMETLSTTVTGPLATEISKPGVKAAAFIDRKSQRVVLHLANVTDQPALIQVSPGKDLAALSPKRTRTSASENAVSLTPLTPASGLLSDTLPPRAVLTLLWESNP